MTLVAQVTPTGIIAPTYDEIRAELVANLRAIYGVDVYLESDSQDGQLVSIYAQSLFDANQMAVAVYNQFSPATAQGVGLSSVVKINGLRRMVASRSTVTVRVVGQVGTIITDGQVGDNLNLNTKWNLPSPTVIPIEGEISVTATNVEDGAIKAAPNSITIILTPTRGWQSVGNVASATPGAPVETDAQLRQRQSISTALPGLSVMDSVIAAVSSLDGVTRLRGYENDQDGPDDIGTPGHSITMVVEGGDATEICETINLVKTPGCGTYGSVTEIVIDAAGVPNRISYFPLTVVDAVARVFVNPKVGYLSTTGDKIKASVAAYVNSLGIGEGALLSKMMQPANLSGVAATTATGLTQAQLDVLSKTFEITGILIGRLADGEAATDLDIAFNEAADLDVANVTIDLP